LFGSGEVSLLDLPSPSGTQSTGMDRTNDIEKGRMIVEDTNTKRDNYGSIPTQQPPSKQLKTFKTDSESAMEQQSRQLQQQPPDEEPANTVTRTNKKLKVLIDPETLKPHSPNQNACLWMFHLLEGVAITAAICLLCTQIIPFLHVLQDSSSSSNNNNNNSSTATTMNRSRNSTTAQVTMGVLTLALRGYITLFCLLFIATELGTPWVHRTLPLLQYYLSRGFLYSFLGLICAEEAYSERVKELIASNSNTNALQHVGWASIFMEVSSWFMLAIGIIYMMLGICCCKRLRDHHQQKENEARKKYKLDMIEWKRNYES
jgi:hypothetical protein